jgi:arsenite methyltransferase
MPEDADEIRAAFEQRFARVARSPDQEQKFPVGPASAKKLGYDPEEIDALPPSVTESFCGVGNPLRLGEALPGQTVLDPGSGAGLDSLFPWAAALSPSALIFFLATC